MPVDRLEKVMRAKRIDLVGEGGLAPRQRHRRLTGKVEYELRPDLGDNLVDPFGVADIEIAEVATIVDRGPRDLVPGGLEERHEVTADEPSRPRYQDPSH
jgi:hypothetical protein